MQKKKVAFLTLGCKTNQYETNGMMQKFQEAGYEICALYDEPDIYVVNTCTVTNIADRKSRQSLRRIKDKKNTIIVACGCYAQVAKEQLEQIPEIDIVLGNKEKKDIVKYVEQYIENSQKDTNLHRDFQTKEIISEKRRPSQMVKVADISKQKEFDTYEELNIDKELKDYDIVLIEINELNFYNASFGFIDYLLENGDKF